MIAKLKELRFGADAGVWRVLFGFDRRRVAVLLVAGEKQGMGQKRLHRALIA